MFTFIINFIIYLFIFNVINLFIFNAGKSYC